MVHHACIRPGDVVLELGGGSGALTREIVARHPNNPLVIFELSAPLAQALAADFPRARVVADSVEALPRRAADLGLSRIDRVVSSVPWALWTLERQTAVLDSFVPLLAHDARFVAVHLMHSKWLGSVAMLDQLLAARFQQVAESDPVWANVPPAYVHIASLPVGRGAAAGTQAQ
jgi:phospholipid N-methyltransferase